MYCNSVWAGVSHSKLERIHKLQKRALRICTHSSFYAPSRPIFHKLNTLTVFDIRTLQIAIIMYRRSHNLLPVSISTFFDFKVNIHSYNTRSSQKAHLYKSPNNVIYNSVRHVGPRVWNSLDPHITNCKTITSFKLYLKRSLLINFTEN